MSKNYLAKRDLESVNLSALDETRKNQVLAIKNGIQLSYENTLEYAGDASKNLTEFSSDLLKSMKVKDTPEVEGLITELMAGLAKVDADTLVEKKPTFWGKLFRVDELKSFVVKYEDVAQIIDDVKAKLEQANFQLKKDIEVCNRYLEQNLKYINELDNYIMAGRLRLQEEQVKLNEEKANLDNTDMLAVHDINAKQSELDRLDRKLHNLMLMRAIAIQNIPQILLIKDGDGVLIEKIDSSINSAIPLWESQMVVAIQLMRQKSALSIQRSVTQTTNKLIEKNSELLREGSVGVSKELEAGIIDVAVLKKSSENLIATLNDIRTVREDGARARLEATRELGQLQIKLNEQMLLTAGNSLPMIEG